MFRCFRAFWTVRWVLGFRFDGLLGFGLDLGIIRAVFVLWVELDECVVFG